MRALPSLRRLLPVCALLAATAVAGCGTSTSGTGGAGADVVASTTQLGDLARAIGAGRADVHQILRPNTDPHEYEPRPDDVKAVANAQVVLRSGDGLDAWVDDVVRQSGSDGAVVDVGARVPDRLPGDADGAEASAVDPHWWHDPANVVAAARVIQAALTRADPAGRATYAANTRAYLARLRVLDAGIRACVARIPPAQRKLVTDHDAFGYFARRYGLDVVGAVIPSQSTSAQPSARELRDLVRTIESEHVRAVFPERSVNPKLAEAIAAQTGARADLRLYGDTLGPAGSSGASYLTMERANADAIVDGLSGGRVRCPISALGRS